MNRVFKPFPVKDLDQFKRKLLEISRLTPDFCLLESNDYDLYPRSNFGFFAAIGQEASISGVEAVDFLEELQQFHREQGDWLFGFLSYDLKNQVETGLVSGNPDGVGCPPGYFFVPRYLLRFHNGEIDLGVTRESHRREFADLLESVEVTEDPSRAVGRLPEWSSRIDKTTYLQKVEALRRHIQRGDIYEANFCMEFFLEEHVLDPVLVFRALNGISRAPFGAFMRRGDLYLMCSSPERYLKKWMGTVTSQPIKGTIRRGENSRSDALLKEKLLQDPKERSENVMIVDLVRNDLARIAEQGSVRVSELFGIYTFEQVHQMISTVECEVSEEVPFTEIIRATFPMGSMTGAPKYRAMELIEALECTRRGLYSGAVGYVTPMSNFDFNVVIRSILHNAARRYTSVQVGSAITMESRPESEYSECLLKARAMREALRSAHI